MSLRVSTVNVNGLRAAIRRGMGDWLRETAPDIVTLQEVRAPLEAIEGLFGAGWWIANAEAAERGRAGVAIAARTPLEPSQVRLAGSRFDTSGRWVEATVATSDQRTLTVVSVYVPKGDAEDETKREEKHSFLQAMTDRATALRAEGGLVLLTGDLNVAHREIDIENWKAYRRTACFLPEYRAHLDRLFDIDGWADLGRALGGVDAGHYTCWSYRGRTMYDRDVGGRLDYQIASPGLAELARCVSVDRIPSGRQRWSDHAPVTVDFDVALDLDRHRSRAAARPGHRSLLQGDQ